MRTLVRNLALLFCWSAISVTGLLAQSRPTTIEIDARDLPRKLLSATLEIPVEPQSQLQKVALWYPKWVPGSHGPGGPIANIAGLSFQDASGRKLDWSRSPGEVYRVEVSVPPETDRIVAQIRYIANQPTTNSMGHDTFGSSLLGVISPGTILLYREDLDVDQTLVDTRLRLPRGWFAATALQNATQQSASEVLSFPSTSLQNFVDSPIMCGLHYRAISLATKGANIPVAPHVLHLFSEHPGSLELNQEIVKCFERMVVQAANLTGSQPFDRFEILLAITDQMPANGLEHSRSTLNVLPTSALQSLGSLKGWSRLLVPHEYLHSWCGKYRRPAEMISKDFHSAGGTDLLWVYEGLTQYLGEVIEARSGLMTMDEFRDRIGVELRNAAHQQNRQWRPLVDTGAASHVLRDGSDAWSKLRGSQDYYMEGMLFWLEVDAILRTRTQGKLTLDSFCQRFFNVGEPAANATNSIPKGFSRQEIVETLQSLLPFDWDGLIRNRIESTRDGYDPLVANMLGYKFEANTERAKISRSTFRLPSGHDHFDTLGMMVAGDGRITDIRLGGPADRAKLGPGMKIVGIGGRKWQPDLLEEAVKESESVKSINLLIEEGYFISNYQIQYSDGPRYLSLLRDESQPDLLESILQSVPAMSPAE